MFGVKGVKVDGVMDYWAPAKKELLGDMKFLQRLKDYDKDWVVSRLGPVPPVEPPR